MVGSLLASCGFGLVWCCMSCVLARAAVSVSVGEVAVVAVKKGRVRVRLALLSWYLDPGGVCFASRLFSFGNLGVS